MNAFLSPTECNLDAFIIQLDKNLLPTEVPLAHDIQKKIPIYDVSKLDLNKDSKALRAEWANVLRNSAGVFVLKNAFQETACIDAASEIFNQIITDEKSEAKVDHFAASGANDRIWNSAQKLCLLNPKVFAQYFGNLAISTACEAWLGPNYQVTSQINLVRPGGKAQSPHRDYHLGFQTTDDAAQYPAHVHDLSPLLTLQGAIAHVDMPIESGPTKILPFSQIYRHGYLAFKQPDFIEYFEKNSVQLPLAKGDALFFNPALYHGGGANLSSNIQRMANLLQVSSAFGVAMETLDRESMSRALFPILKDNTANLSTFEIDAAVTACAAGYSFPTNLDASPPVAGLAPETQANLLRRALSEKMGQTEFEKALKTLKTRKIP